MFKIPQLQLQVQLLPVVVRLDCSLFAVGVTDRLQRWVTRRGFKVLSGEVTTSHVTVSRYLHVYLIDNRR
jgi:hypothetical protein